MVGFSNDKGFLILEVSREELMLALWCYGCAGVCDRCLEKPDKGYYIAALNQWFCQDCFEDWYAKARKYQEDIPIEERNYKYFKEILSRINVFSFEPDFN